jgi:GLPGLI family protein
MLNKLFFLVVLLFTTSTLLNAQEDFYNRGTITYEYKVNNHKNFWWGEDDENGQEDVWRKQMIENTPKFSTYYYTLKFAENKSLFSYQGRDEKVKKMWEDDSKEDNIWFVDFDQQKSLNQRNIFGEVFKLEDSIGKIKWKLIPTDTRDFAGFTCKKAIGVLFDSVYVFAYYTDAMTLTGGPMNMNGLPGTILGVTIPRLSISCIATSFSPLVNAAEVAPPKKGKIKPKADIYKKIKEATKDWGKYGQKAIWQSFL